MRLIDADALKEKRIFDHENWQMVITVDEIDDAPTIDAEPVRHGKWEKAKAAFHKKCSYCKSVLHMPRERNYCPNCGAKMDAEVEG